MGRHVRVRHGRGCHVLLGQGRLWHHVRGLGHSVQWRVGVHVHGLLLSLGRLLLLTRRRSLHPLLAGPLTGVAGRHPVVVLSQPGHPRLSPRAPGSHLVLTGVARGHPVTRLAHHGHPLLAWTSRHHLMLTWMAGRHSVVVLSHSRHLLAGRHHMLPRSHPRSHGSLTGPHPGHYSSHRHSDIAHRHLDMVMVTLSLLPQTR